MSYMAKRSRSLGADSASSAGFFEDLVNAGGGVVDAGRDELTGSAGEIAEKIIRSSQFKIVLDAVEEKAEKGVKDVVALNAIGLVGLCIGGGALGGGLAQGKIGVVGGLVVTGLSIAWMVAVNKPAKKK